MFPTLEISHLKDIPGYKAILKSVLKCQIQLLVEQLSDHTEEESVVITASVSDGTLCQLGSNAGKNFLDGRDEIKSQFLGHCLKNCHKQKTATSESKQKAGASLTGNADFTTDSLPPRSRQYSHNASSNIHPVSLTRNSSVDRLALHAPSNAPYQRAGDASTGDFRRKRPNPFYSNVRRRPYSAGQFRAGRHSASSQVSDVPRNPGRTVSGFQEKTTLPTFSSSQSSSATASVLKQSFETDKDSVTIKTETVDPVELSATQTGSAMEDIDSLASAIFASSEQQNVSETPEGLPSVPVSTLNQALAISTAEASQESGETIPTGSNSNVLDFGLTDSVDTEQTSATEGVEGSVVKVEPISESDLELEITGVEMASSSSAQANNSEGQSQYSAWDQTVSQQTSYGTGYQTSQARNSNDEEDNSLELESIDESSQQNVTMWSCQVCSYNTRRRSNLKRHESTVHNTSTSDGNAMRDSASGEMYVCEKCGKQFKSRYGLTVHHKMKHEKVFRFMCPTCNKGFHQLWNFRGHLSSHHPELRHPCETCQKTFGCKQSLQQHRKVCEKSPDTTNTAQFSCSKCTATFTSKKSLPDHERAMHGSKQFVCKLCLKSFKWRSSLAYHMKSFHYH